MDLTPVTDVIAAAVGDVSIIGLACLGVIVVVASFSWFRRAIR